MRKRFDRCALVHRVKTMAVARFDKPDGSGPIVIDDSRFPVDTNKLDGKPPARVGRLVYAAAHIVMKGSYQPFLTTDEGDASTADLSEQIDWETTMAIRRQLASQGFGIAEAMDTAQRFEVGWQVAHELIRRTSELKAPLGFVAGASTDHLSSIHSQQDLIDGVVFQVSTIQRYGGIPTILPLPWLTVNKKGEKTYLEVYGEIIRQSQGPIILHWLGEMFLPSLRGYFPGDSFERIMALDPSKVIGAKISLLDVEREQQLRRRLLQDEQLVFTGDDWHFAELIAGNQSAPQHLRRVGPIDVALGDFSHALLGIFDGIAAPARAALLQLEAGNVDEYFNIMRPCEQLSQIIFETPTQHYKTGLAFLSWLNGYQENRLLPYSAERHRSSDYLLRVAEAAARAGALTDAPLAVDRLNSLVAEDKG